MTSNIFNAHKTAQYLKSNNNYLILTHDNPDGDTLGSAFALCYALRSIGKNANIIIEEMPKKFEFLGADYFNQSFVPSTVVAVDIASIGMFGQKTKQYYEKVDLCIDHHGSNSKYAKNLFLNETAAANCENMYDVIEKMGVTITSLIATCLYTGIATDTGCFKFSNVTPNTHIYAGALMTYGVDIATINFALFEEKSREYMLAEKMVIDTLEYHADGKIALCSVTKEITDSTGLLQSDLDSMVAIPRRIAGVEIGITLKERDDGFKVSFRTSEKVNATQIASQFDGGGHLRAAGCFIKGDIDKVKRVVLTACQTVVEGL